MAGAKMQRSAMRKTQRTLLLGILVLSFAAANTGYAAKRPPAKTPTPTVITTEKPVISAK
jgi:hypothetical protein